LAWIENGPVSLPPSQIARLAAAAMFALALAGAALGFRAAQREERPSLDEADTVADQATPARPIVEIPSVQEQTAAANATASNATADSAGEAAESNAIAAKTAAAEEVQSKQPADIDDILTSQSEKPQAPAKPTGDESAPGAPDKGANDVPF